MNKGPVKIASGVVVFASLTAVAVAAQMKASFAWHILGSACALGALSLLLWQAARVYPFIWGKVTVRGRELELDSLGRRLWPPLLVMGVAVGVVAPLLTGQMPLSHDHPVHLYKAWHFWEEMLLDGRLRGWSSFWFFGYPAEELYPIGPDIWVALFRLVTFGLLSWEATYGLAFVGVFAFAAYAVYAFGKRHFGATAGVVAGVLWVLDMGDYREGGWSYTVDWAVWVQILAMAFLLLALARLEVVLQRGRARDHAICGLLFAAALLSHQMNVMLLGLGIPLLLLSRWLCGQGRLGKDVAATAAPLAIGAAIASFWLLPMLTRSGWTTSIGDLWRPFSTTVRGLVDGTTFANVIPLAVMLGLVGAALGIAMRRAVPIFLLLLSAVLLLLSSKTAFDELSLMAISQAFSKIQYQRLVIPAKAGFFLLAGFAVGELCRRVAAWRAQQREQAGPQKERPVGRAAALATLVVLVMAPFARPAVNVLHKSYLRTIGGLVLKKSIYYYDDYKDFLAWSAKKRAESREFYRISYELDRHNHLMMGAPAFNSTPYYKVGYTPAKLFKHVTETTEAELYEALSVKYVVTLGQPHSSHLVDETRFGSVWVSRFIKYRPQRYTLTGPGKVKVKEFSEEHIQLELSGTGPNSRLKVHVSNYPRWRARQDGEDLVISEAPAYGTTYPMLMEVKVKDGELTFDYVMRWPDWLGTLATLAGLGVVGLLLMARRRPQLVEPLHQRLAPAGRLAARYAGYAVLVCSLAAVGFIIYRVTGGKASGMAEDSLAKKLHTARVTQAGQACGEKKSTPYGMGWSCSARSWNYVGHTTNKFNGAFLPCIWAHPVDEGPLVVTFPGVTLGQAIVGNHGIADGAVDSFAGGAPVTLEVKVDGKTLETLVRANVKGWVGFRVSTKELAGQKADVSFTVSTTSAGGRHYCFDARVQ